MRCILVLLVFLLSCGRPDSDSGGVCISFDDRTIKEWYGLQSLFEKYDAKATFFITEFDSLTPQEIAILKKMEGYGHEIGSHGAAHLLAEDFIKENGYDAYVQKEIDHSIASMKAAGFNVNSFAYPYGSKYWFTDHLLKKRFKVLRGVAALPEDKNLYAFDDAFCKTGEDVVSAVSFDVNSDLTREIAEKALQRARKNKEVLVLFGHVPADSNSAENQYSFDVALLEYILAEAKRKHLKFYTMQELAMN
jgi:peptidoglycan-N-acetylglucosamine deacetylase